MRRMGKREEAGRAAEWHGRKKGKKASQEQCGGNNSVLKKIKDVASESVQSRSDSEHESTEGSQSYEGSSDKSSENEGEHDKCSVSSESDRGSSNASEASESMCSDSNTPLYCIQQRL